MQARRRRVIKVKPAGLHPPMAVGLDVTSPKRNRSEGSKVGGGIGCRS
jgi:hypothetical protein